MGAFNSFITDTTLYSNHVAVSKSDADTTETALRTFTLPGGTMGPNDTLRITTRWTFPNSATTKVMRIRLGGTSCGHHTATTGTAAFTSQVNISNRDAANSQISAPGGSNVLLGGHGGAFTFTAVNTAVDQDIAIQATWGTAGDGTANITLESVIIELVRG